MAGEECPVGPALSSIAFDWRRYQTARVPYQDPTRCPTFLVDGQVAGAWRYDKGKVRIDPFARRRTDVRRRLEDEADRLAAFHAD